MSIHGQLDILKQMIPPPRAPSFARGDWSAIEQTLGVEFPKDFQLLVNTYGTGVFNGQLALYSPFVANESGLLDLIDVWLHNFVSYRRDKIGNWNELKLSIFPEPDGLLPFAYAENGPILCWQTAGKPEQWPIYVWYNDDIAMYNTGYRSFTRFLVELLQQKASLIPILTPGTYRPGYGPPWRFQSLDPATGFDWK